MEHTEDYALQKPVPISPLVNRRVVMEEAFGLGKCLANMKNDPKILNEPACVKANKFIPILPPPVSASRVKLRQNTEISNPPTKAEIYRHTLGLDNKHPIAALHELCQKNKWTAPKFNEIVDGGKKWRFSALVNGKEFPSSKLFVRKKEAKVEAAIICLLRWAFYSSK